MTQAVRSPRMVVMIFTATISPTAHRHDCLPKCTRHFVLVDGEQLTIFGLKHPIPDMENSFFLSGIYDFMEKKQMIDWVKC